MQIEYKEIPLEIEYRYYEELKQTEDCPVTPEDVDIDSIVINRDVFLKKAYSLDEEFLDFFILAGRLCKYDFKENEEDELKALILKQLKKDAEDGDI
jgi:hypothetical protein